MIGQSIVNLNTIKDFHTIGQSLGRSDYFRVVFDVFVESFDKDLESLGAACEKNDCQRIRGLCHRMKSSAFTVGAEILGRLLVKLETYAEEFYQDTGLYSKIYAEIESVYKQSVAVIEESIQAYEQTGDVV
jgi:HPt (histidine-containing phosphotransfer) domain-containing protein